MNTVKNHLTVVVKAAALLFASAWLALPTSQAQSSTFASFTRVVIAGPSIDAPPWGNALGDIDGDGYPDVAAGFASERRIYWYQYPTWSKHLIGTHDGEGDILIADINDDGSLDVVAATGDGLDGVAWYENPRGHGGNPATDSWTRHVIEDSVHWDRGQDLQVGDLNRDGKVDLVIRLETGPTYVYLQDEPDSWTKILLPNANNGNGVALLDVNRDGKLDIVENGYWLEQPIDPVHDNWPRHDFGAWPNDSSIAVGDVNNDGRPDIVLASQGHFGQISWFEEPSDPINGYWMEHVILSPANYVSRIRLGDFNKDGTIDVAFAEMSQSDTRRVGVLYNNASGALWSLQVLGTTAGHKIVIADVQADGDLDLLNADGTTGRLEIWLNDVNNALSLVSWSYAQIDSIRAAKGSGLNFGDIDGDGRTDIVSGHYWYRNPDGDPTANWVRFELPAGMDDGMLVLDADNDGWADILAEGPITGSTQLGVYWLRNNGQGSSWSPVLVGSLPPVPGDFKSQGYALAQIVPGHSPEIVLTSGMGGYYFQVPGNPGLGNWPRTLISADIAPKGVAAADINDDGKLDVIAFSNSDPGRIVWWENPGTGAPDWLHHDVGATSGIPGDRVAAADIDHNGRTDIIVTEANLAASGNSLFWFAQPEKLATGEWRRHTVASDQASLNSLDVADIDGDGKMDIVTAEYRGSLNVSIWQNVDNGAAFRQHIVSSGRESYLGARVFDLDRDGAPDIVSIANDTYTHLHLWHNDALKSSSRSLTTANGGVPGNTTNRTAVAKVGALAATPPVIFAASTVATPTLVQHVSGSNAQQRVTLYSLPLPNPVLPGNCVVVGVRKDSDNSTVTVSDDQGNIYIAGPSRSDGARTVALYYRLNITNAPKIIRVMFSGIGSYWVSVVASEFNNVAAASAADGSNTNIGGGASLNTNNITTTTDGDLIYNYAAVSSDDTSTEMASWTPGAGYSLLSADLFDKHAAQYTVQATHGTINSPMTMSPSGGWISVAMALKADTAGTRPGPGIHVDKVLHNGIPVAWSSSRAKVQIPSAGNLLVAIFASEPSATITSISDTAGHSWSSTGPDVDAGSSISAMKYVANASPSDTNVVTYNYARSVGGGDTCIVFDISGADPTAPFDKRGTASGNQLTGTSYIGASVTPATSNGLVISVSAVESHTVIAVSPETLIASTTTPETSPWPDDENNGYAMLYNVNTNTITSSWTSDGPVAGWTEILAAFKSVADTAAPTVSMTAPATGAMVTGKVTVSATASDNVGVVGVQFQLDGANLLAEVTAPPYSVSWDTTTATTGSHTLTAIARDAAGNRTTSSPVTVTVDTIMPTVSLTSPANAAFVSGTISLSATASDNVGVVGVQFQLDGANLAAEVTASPYSVSWNTITTANGSHTLTAIARDAAGNKTTSSVVTVTVDNSPPTVSLTSPGDGGSVSGTITVSATASDNVNVIGVQFQLDGANLGTEVTAPPYSVSWDTTNSTNSSHTLTAIARDAAGNRTTASAVTLTVNNDPTRPTVSLTSPSNGAFVSGTIAVSATASDNVGVAGVQFQLDGANLGAEVTAAPYSVSWDTTSSMTGSHTLTAIARNTAENRTTSSAVTVTVDNIPPAVSVTNPSNGASISGTITVSAAASDNVSVVGVQFQLDGANLGAEVTASPYSVSWNTTTTTNGSHTLTAIARDAAGNRTTSSAVTVTVDNIPPAVSVTSPSNGASMSGTVTVSAAASDNVSVVGVQFQLDGANLGAEVTASPYSVSWNTTTTTNGSHTLTAIARDAAGNKTTSSAVIVTVDNVSPTVSLTSPSNGAFVSATIAVSAAASDNVGVVGVQFQLDGANVGTEVTAPPYSVSWNTMTATDGSHTLTAIARDAAGNKTTSSAVIVTIDNVPPMVSLTSPSNGTSVSGTITVSAAASDNVGVVGVQFQLDGANLGAEVTASPYSVSWNTTSTSNGSHTLTAIARDAAGNRTTASAVTVTVSNVSTVAFAQGSALTNDASSTTIVRAFAAATTVGDLIVAAISWGSNAGVSCSDSQGNTYTVATTQYDNISNQSLAICYAANIKGGADTITVRFSSTASYRRLLIHEYRGVALAGPVDVVAKNVANGSTTSNTITSTAATTIASGDLVFGAVMDDTGVNNITAGTGFTLRQSVNNKDLASEDLVQPLNGSVAATFTFSTAHRYLAQMVAFKHR